MRRAFPRTLAEFQGSFSTEDACRAYLFASRWPEGFRCPACSGPEAFEVRTRGLYECWRCRHQTSVTAGSVLHATRVSFRLWFWAAYLVATHTPGMSAVQLQRQLGLTRYETAWTTLQKLRGAMVRPERDRIGGVEEGQRGGRAQTSRNAIATAAVEVKGRGSGQVRMAVIPDVSAASLVSLRPSRSQARQRRQDRRLARLPATPRRRR